MKNFQLKKIDYNEYDHMENFHLKKKDYNEYNQMEYFNLKKKIIMNIIKWNIFN